MPEQPNQPERKQAAQFGAVLSGAHLVGRERVRAFHVSVAMIDGVLPIKSPSRPGRDITKERDAEKRTGREHQGLRITDYSMITRFLINREQLFIEVSSWRAKNPRSVRMFWR
ncbi:hypothetical protein [uncultured Paracoccus sp.]|uniref:hypothetical protein n=1 Tax=uncultured Paracoccus sp. TaxID=189685 RepID=UPI00261A667F|nr:hypothetical protein [uncultured Paracoccus sp.]